MTSPFSMWEESNALQCNAVEKYDLSRQPALFVDVEAMWCKTKMLFPVERGTWVYIQPRRSDLFSRHKRLEKRSSSQLDKNSCSPLNGKQLIMLLTIKLRREKLSNTENTKFIVIATTVMVITTLLCLLLTKNIIVINLCVHVRQCICWGR